MEDLDNISINIPPRTKRRGRIIFDGEVDEISYKAGIKLVVDWLKENSWDDDGVQLFIPTDWQDQLKEWDVQK